MNDKIDHEGLVLFRESLSWYFLCVKEAYEMCEANAYVINEGKEELIMERVDKVIPQGEELYLENIFGQRKTIKGKIIEMALVDHKIILEKS